MIETISRLDAIAKFDQAHLAWPSLLCLLLDEERVLSAEALAARLPTLVDSVLLGETLRRIADSPAGNWILRRSESPFRDIGYEINPENRTEIIKLVADALHLRSELLVITKAREDPFPDLWQNLRFFDRCSKTARDFLPPDSRSTESRTAAYCYLYPIRIAIIDTEPESNPDDVIDDIVALLRMFRHHRNIARRFGDHWSLVVLDKLTSTHMARMAQFHTAVASHSDIIRLFAGLPKSRQGALSLIEWARLFGFSGFARLPILEQVVAFDSGRTQ